MAKKTEPLSLAYTAGIIEGEGTIVIGKCKAGKGYRRKYKFVLKVRVVNTNEWLIQWLKFNFGGSIASHHPQKPTYKPYWSWNLDARKAAEFLRIILPYLNFKRPQAELALEFQAKKRCGGRPLSDEEWAVAEAQRILMQSYHK